MSERSWVGFLVGAVVGASACAGNEPCAREPGWPSKQLEPTPLVRPPVVTAPRTPPTTPPTTDQDEPRVAIVDHGSGLNAATRAPATVNQASNGAFPDESQPSPPTAAAAAASATTPPPQLGNISNAAEVVAAMRPDFRTCYQQQLGRDATFEGKLRLLIRIGADGHVTQVEVSPRESPADLVECVVRRAQMSVFLPPDGGKTAVIAVPLTFVKQ